MDELHNLLVSINFVLWGFDAITVGLFYMIYKRTGQAKSSFVTMVVVVFSTMVMMGYEGLLVHYIVPNITNPVLNFFWYMGFASFALITLMALYKVHEMENLKIASVGQYLGTVYFILASLQLAQYSEIVLFNSQDTLFYVYLIGVPTVNIAATAVCFAMAALATYRLNNTKPGLRRFTKWSL